mgnify:CR=1 FL=1
MENGVYQATLTYFLDEVMMDIPITVAPVLNTYYGKPISGLTESDLNRFISNTDALKDNPSRDLNGDKSVDYIDDYIFIANYLVQAVQTKVPIMEKNDTKSKSKAK